MTNRTLTAVGWIGTMLVALAVGRFAALDPQWDAWLVWAAAAGAACLGIHAVVSRRERARHPSLAAERSRLTPAILVSAVAVAIALNVVARIYSTRWDLTATHQYQLATETRAAIRSLDAPVRLLLFARTGDFPAYRDRLKELSYASPRIEIQYVDVDRQPMLVKEYDVQKEGTAVLEYKGRVERIMASSEQEFTNALRRLRAGRTRKVYFTTGHAERDTASTERVGYSNIAAALQRENFVVSQINLARDGDFPDDVTLVVVAGPRADFFRAEIESLQRYIDRGGAILFLVDPYEDLKRYITESGSALFMMDPGSASVAGELRNLTALIRDHGAELGNDVVVDTSQMGQYIGTDASVPVASSYPPHPITEAITALSAYPMARSVRPLPGGRVTASPIVETSEMTWSETDIQQLASGRFSMDPDKGDRPGPVTLGVAITALPAARPAAGGPPPRQPRLVVVGDSDFVANYVGNIPGNTDIFLSMIRWLAQENVVTIPPRMPEERVLTIDGRQLRVLSWFALLLLPALAVGMAAYLRGRK